MKKGDTSELCNRVLFRFTNAEDINWFENAICRVVREKVDESLSLEDAEPYFADFFRDAPEPTGEEESDADFEAPKIYEEVSTI